MSPLTEIKVALLVILLGAGTTGVLSYRHLAKKADTADARIAAAEAKAAATQRQLDTLSQEIVRRAEFDAAIRDARARVSRNLDQAASEDPAARDYLGEPIPQRVRDALRGVRAVPAPDGDRRPAQVAP